MMIRSRVGLLRTVILLAVLPWFAAGCCCIEGVPSCGDCGLGCATGGCGPSVGPGPLASLASCRGACGDVYVGEWISEPPTVDNCGYPCGGCGHCGHCQPIRSLLRLLWGRPYVTNCSTGLCGPSCGGCDSCGEGVASEYIDGGSSHGANCNCGAHHDTIQGGSLRPTPSATPYHDVQPSEVVPTPAPEIAPSSARRLNPAVQHRAVRRASAVR